MSNWYKMDPLDWNEGTEELTLEQEAAYLRICNAIYITERPIRENGFIIAGLFRCNDRKAKRLLKELVEAGKLTVKDGLIFNKRAIDEVSNRSRVRAERQSAGSRGGVQSGISRANSLKNNNQDEAIGSTKNKPDKIREDNKDVSRKPAKRRSSYLQAFEDFWKEYPTDALMSKKQAALVFEKLDEATQSDVIRSLPGFINYCTTNPDYRPVHACRYISQQRYEGFLSQASGKEDPNLIALPADHEDFKAVEKYRGKTIHPGQYGTTTFKKSEIEQARQSTSEIGKE